MPDLILSEDFKKNLAARAESTEGKEALNRFTDLIAQWAIDNMSPDIKDALLTPEGIPELMKMWPQIVDAYFRALSGPRPANKPRKPRRGKAKGRGPTQQQIDADYERLLAEHSAALQKYRLAWGTPELIPTAHEVDESLKCLKDFAAEHAPHYSSYARN